MSLEAGWAADPTYSHGPAFRSNPGEGMRDSGQTSGENCPQLRDQGLWGGTGSRSELVLQLAWLP